MPLINASRIIASPRLSTLFDVVRREETINEFGETEVTEVRFEDVRGVICAASKPLVRLPEAQHTPNQVNVTTNFRLRSAEDGFQPDLIEWKGNSYLVTQVDDYSEYGSGHTSAVCDLQSKVENPDV